MRPLMFCRLMLCCLYLEVHHTYLSIRVFVLKKVFPTRMEQLRFFRKTIQKHLFCCLDENVMDILVQAVLLVHLYSSYSTFAMLVC